MRRAAIRWCRATNISVFAGVRVVHVLHGARDYERLLFPET
jgi:hypothetical protein